MNYFTTLFQEIIFKSRYARWRDDLGRREEWPETVARYFDFFENHLQDKHNFKLTTELRKELEDAILNLKVMPSMRSLMTAGPALKRCNVAGYNCAYLPIDHPRAFDETLYVLMSGTGVGFSVEHKDVDRLPTINEHFEHSSTVIVVDDSKQGWAKGLRELLAMLYVGQIPTWDLSKLRPAGAILKTFGGRSSGPEPLNDLFEFAVKLFTKAAGRRLTDIECHDLVCYIAQIVVVGGVRRASLISLSNLDSRAMQEAKSGQWWLLEPQRALANNSAVYSRTPDEVTFMEEWLALVKSQSGERGIFNRQAAIKQVAKNGRRDPNHRWGINPCCVTGETLLLTDKGYVPIVDTIDKEITIWNGNEWSKVTPFETGIQETSIVTFSNGASLRCTPNHKFVLSNNQRVELDDLKVGDKLAKFTMPTIDPHKGVGYFQDAYSQGFYSGDGNHGLRYSWLYNTKYMCQNRLVGDFTEESYGRKTWKHGGMFGKDWVPYNGSLDYKLNWLAGLLDADGCVTNDIHGNGLQIGSINPNFLNSIRLILTTMGVQAKVINGILAGDRFLPKNDGSGKLGLYPCKNMYRLLIGNQDTYHLVSLGLKTERLIIHGEAPQRDARCFIYVTSIEEVEPCETYCFNEPKNHTGTFNGVVTGQSEIILRPYQFCNLTEVVVRRDDTLETLKKKVRIATVLGTIQATLTDFKYLRKVWRDNTEEERLLGVSLTGIFDGPELSEDELEELKQHAVEVNKEYAKLLGIPVSTAITCVKPSGTVSQLVDSSSGIHPRHSKYYIRTIRGDKKDPLTKFLQDAGIPCEDDVMKPKDTVVFSFPQKAPDGAKTREDIEKAVEHLGVWLKYQRHWCEHKPSVTISVRQNEWLDVAAWTYGHFDEVSGISFLPHSDHTYKQAPYQECTEEEYTKALSKMPVSINWDKLSEYEKEDNTVALQTLSCSGGICEI